MTKMFARTPIIALDYSQRHKAQKKELLIDYENGCNIYVVSAEDKEVIFDITAKIAEKVEGLTGDKIEIEIEGIGKVNLTEVLKQIRLELDDTVQAVEAGDTVYVGKENVLDDKSINANDRYIQIKGFDSADTYMIPRKGINGQIEWVYPNIMPDDGNSGGNNGGIIPNPNPDDGVVQGVYLIEPIGDKLYLRATRRQKSVNVPKNCIVVLPKIIDTFSEIEWYVKTNSFSPLFKFSDNVIWDNPAMTQPKPDSSQLYKFKTWDAGETWLAEFVVYNKGLNAVIDKDYLDRNYYDKQEIVDNYYDKPQVNEISKSIIELIPEGGVSDEVLKDYYNKKQIDDKDSEIMSKIPDMSNYYDRSEVDDKDKDILGKIPDMNDYYNKNHIDENYYNKETVNEKLDNINTVNPENYYNKDQIDDSFYTKKHIDDQHYNKSTVDEKFKWIKNGNSFADENFEI